MGLIELKCTHCKALLEQEGSTFKYICPFCKSEFILEEDKTTLQDYDNDHLDWSF